VLTKTERRLRARLAAASGHAKYNTSYLTSAAREALEAKWLLEVDPDEILPPDERLRRAKCAQRAHLLRATLASMVADRKKREAAALAVSAEAAKQSRLAQGLPEVVDDPSTLSRIADLVSLPQDGDAPRRRRQNGGPPCVGPE